MNLKQKVLQKASFLFKIAQRGRSLNTLECIVHYILVNHLSSPFPNMISPRSGVSRQLGCLGSSSLQSPLIKAAWHVWIFMYIKIIYYIYTSYFSCISLRIYIYRYIGCIHAVYICFLNINIVVYSSMYEAAYERYVCLRYVYIYLSLQPTLFN